MITQLRSGASLSYTDRGTGLPLVLLHAFPLSSAMWGQQVAALSSTYRIVAPDARGCNGSSPFDGAPSLDQLARDAAELCEALDLGQVVLGGLSMGGYTALAFARLFPQKLRGLILADTRAEADDESGKANREALIQLAKTNGSLAVAQKMLPALTSEAGRCAKPELASFVEKTGAAYSDEAIANLIRALRDRPDSRPYLSDIKVPTLVISGEDDVITTPVTMERLANGITGALFESIPEAGHLANLEQPELFNEAITKFLEKL